MNSQAPSGWLSGPALTRQRAQGSSREGSPQEQSLSVLVPRTLTVIAGRPAMGKTALALHLAHRSAVERGRSVAVVSPVMPPHSVVCRLLARTSGVAIGRIHTGILSDTQRARVNEAEAVLERSPLYLECTRALDHEELRARLQGLRDRVGALGLVVIDEPEELCSDNPWLLLADLAAELDCAIVTTARLSRAVDERCDHRPTPHDLIDRLARRHASTLLMLYREEYYASKPEHPGVMEVFVERRERSFMAHMTLDCDLATGVFSPREVGALDASRDDCLEGAAAPVDA